MYLINFIYGIVIGIGFIIPGVSGCVIATIIGIYDEIVYRLNHLFNNIKDNILYITPLFLGILISIIFFSKIILYLLQYKLYFISYVFMGLILGCIPYLINTIKIKTNKGISFIPFIISIIIGIILYIIQINNVIYSTNPSLLTLLVGGLFYAIGKIVPGISGSSLLIFLGIYKFLLNIIANPLDINIYTIYSLIPFIISFLISAVLILRLIEYLLKYHFRITYSLIIGFVLSSTLFIYPNYISIGSIFILIISFAIAYYLSK